MISRHGALGATFTRGKVAGSSAAVLLAAAVPFLYPNPYGLGVLVTMLTIMLLNVSWSFLLGVAGVWNFGQLAIYAVGGYGAGLSILHLGLTPWLALPVAGVTGAALAIAIAIPTLRLSGIYTALLTFSAAQVVQLLIQNDTSGLTGGALGLPGVPGLFASLSPLDAAKRYYWLCLAIVVVAVAISAVVVRSRFGLALRTVRESAAYGAARGIDVHRSRVVAFAASGFFAGVAGALYTIYNGSMTPTVMGLTPMSIYVAMLVVGGLGTVAGPIVGTVVVTAIQPALIARPGTQLTVLGTILLLIVIFLPRGVANECGRLWSRIKLLAEEEEEEPGLGDEHAGLSDRLPVA